MDFLQKKWYIVFILIMYVLEKYQIAETRIELRTICYSLHLFVTNNICVE